LHRDAIGSVRTTRSAQHNAVYLARQHVISEMGQLDLVPTDQAALVNQIAHNPDLECPVTPCFRVLGHEGPIHSFGELSVSESAVEMLDCLSFKAKV